MKVKKITLREHPKLEFILRKNEFEVISEKDTYNNGVFKYSTIEFFEFKKKGLDWILAFLGVIVEFLFDVGYLYFNKNRFVFNYKKKKRTILLPDCDLEKAELVARMIKVKLF